MVLIDTRSKVNGFRANKLHSLFVDLITMELNECLFAVRRTGLDLSVWIILYIPDLTMLVNKFKLNAKK